MQKPPGSIALTPSILLSGHRQDYLAKRVCGYRDVIIIIRVNGLLCEVQCHLESMYALRKGFGYRDYAMMYVALHSSASFL